MLRFICSSIVQRSQCLCRKRLRKRKRGEANNHDGSEENSEDGSGTKNSESLAKPSSHDSRSNDQDTITVSDEEETRSGRREPSRFDPTVEPAQLERPKFKSVRDFFGEDEAVYIMDAKTTGNIGRYLNVRCASILHYHCQLATRDLTRSTKPRGVTIQLIFFSAFV